MGPRPDSHLLLQAPAGLPGQGCEEGLVAERMGPAIKFPETWARQPHPRGLDTATCHHGSQKTCDTRAVEAGGVKKAVLEGCRKTGRLQDGNVASFPGGRQALTWRCFGPASGRAAGRRDDQLETWRVQWRAGRKLSCQNAFWTRVNDEGGDQVDWSCDGFPFLAAPRGFGHGGQSSSLCQNALLEG